VIETSANYVALDTALRGLAYGGTIEVHLDSPDGPLVSTCWVPFTGGWQKWQTVAAPVTQSVSGVHAVYLVFTGGPHRLFDLDSFWFTR